MGCLDPCPLNHIHLDQDLGNKVAGIKITKSILQETVRIRNYLSRRFNLHEKLGTRATALLSGQNLGQYFWARTSAQYFWDRASSCFCLPVLGKSWRLIFERKPCIFLRNSSGVVQPEESEVRELSGKESGIISGSPFKGFCLAFTNTRGFRNQFRTPSPSVRQPHFLWLGLLSPKTLIRWMLAAPTERWQTHQRSDSQSR